MSARSRLITIYVSLAGVGLVWSRPAAQPASHNPLPVESKAVGFGETIAVRDLPPASADRAASGTNKGRTSNLNGAQRTAARRGRPLIRRNARVSTAAQDDALSTTTQTPRIPAPTVTFEGLGRTENIAAGFGDVVVPNTSGDVGPNHYVQQVQFLVRVWNKSGSPLTNPFKLSDLFAVANGGPGGQCAAADAGSPIVLYDPLADRWMLSQFAFESDTTPPFHECIAVSKTPDPTGAYYAYDFVTNGAEFPDFPKLGVWPDGYYMMVHQLTNGVTLSGTGMYAFNRVKMLAGDPTANYVYFNLVISHPELIFGGLPSDFDGLTPPPVGAPNVFAYFTGTIFGDPADGIRLFNFHADFTTPANSTFVERPESSYGAPMPVAPFDLEIPPGLGNVPQPAPAETETTALDALNDRFMHRLQYRNQGSYETLVVTHTVGAPASTTFGDYRAAPRYYELRSTGGGSYSVHEQGTYAPGGAPPGDKISRWMGSAAEDRQGNLAIGYSVSSGSAGGDVFPGIRYAGRLAADPAGTLAQGEGTLIAGTGVQTSQLNLWGSYSGLSVDPVDDCTFWYTTEYYTAAGQAASPVGWQTRIGSFKFVECTAAAKGTGHFAITACSTPTALPNAVVTIDGRPYGATISGGTFDASLAPGMHAYSVSRAGYSSASGSFSVSNGVTTNLPICLQGVPSLASSGSSLTAEACGAPNGVIDPGETVTVSLCVVNTGGLGGTTSSLVGTLQATGGVTSPGAPQSYGAVVSGGPQVCRNFSFTASGSCGGALTASLQLQDGATSFGTVTYGYTLGTEITPLNQTVDGVTVPNLPSGWAAANVVGSVPLWASSNTGSPLPAADSAPNAFFVDDPSEPSDKRLESPVFSYASPSTQLSFRHNFDLEAYVPSMTAYDVGVLEISVSGGAFQDILTAGGSFVSGGYTYPGISPDYNNPLLPSRPNWSGSSGGFITTIVNLPASAAGLPVKLRWRMGSDLLVGHAGWRVDNVKVSEGFTCAACGVFTDDPLVAQSTVVKAVHIIQLRSRVDAQRARFLLPPATWTDGSLTGVPIKAVHITELRSALAAAYTAHGLTPPTYTDPGLGAGTAIKAIHITQLRNAVIALEGS